MKRFREIAAIAAVFVWIAGCASPVALGETVQSAGDSSHAVVTFGGGNSDSSVPSEPSAAKESTTTTPQVAVEPEITEAQAASAGATEAPPVMDTETPVAGTEVPPMVTEFDDREPDLDKALDVTCIYDSVYGLRLDVPELYQEGVHCNTTSSVPFAFYDPASNAAIPGGGRIWTIGAYNYEEFLTCFGQDGTEWTSSSLGASDYVLGRTEDYIFVLSLPTDVQFTEATQSAYQDYQAIGHQLVADFLVINNIEANPDWQSFY